MRGLLALSERNEVEAPWIQMKGEPKRELSPSLSLDPFYPFARRRPYLRRRCRQLVLIVFHSPCCVAMAPIEVKKICCSA
jgi:hypothetical protein